jgi:hypothetical protein
MPRNNRATVKSHRRPQRNKHLRGLKALDALTYRAVLNARPEELTF